MALIWLVIGVALAVAEIFSATFVLIMLAAGAFAAAAAAALDANLAVQGIVFTLVSALALAAVRPVIRKHVHTSENDTPMGLAVIEGSTATVLEQVDAEHGLVKIEGEMWRARPYDATQTFPVGEQVRVIEVKGATAMVWRD